MRHHIKLLKRCFSTSPALECLSPARTRSLGSRCSTPDNRRERYLDEAELAAPAEVLRTDANRPVCKIALFLARVRRSAERGACQRTWDQIDRDNGCGAYPATNSKSKEDPRRAAQRQRARGPGEVGTEGRYGHVFVNEETGKPYTTIAKVWDRLRKTAEFRA